jgi:hypothetical protein
MQHLLSPGHKVGESRAARDPALGDSSQDVCPTDIERLETFLRWAMGEAG